MATSARFRSRWISSSPDDAIGVLLIPCSVTRPGAENAQHESRGSGHRA